MKTKKVTLNVDAAIWEKYTKKVEEKEGTTYGKLGSILTRLITEYYLKEKATTLDDSQLQQDYEKLKKELNNLKEENKKLNNKLNEEPKNTSDDNKDQIKNLEEKNEHPHKRKKRNTKTTQHPPTRI